jgi:uncharacterized protein YyaL (SSP411 family)
MVWYADPEEWLMSNRLIQEKSPYLLQHAENPVDWFPWGDEAFSRARRENRPIFLSIGYATCHWCHVMERESFERHDVAELMNRTFVSIKVDREERPDIDGVYMQVCQMLTGSGGWPLTVVMTPDGKPFFAGTYFPRESRLGRIGLLDLIPRIESLWLNQKQDVLRITEKIIGSLEGYNRVTNTGTLPDETVLEKAYREMKADYDETFSGFGTVPKFPSPSNLLFLLRYWRRNPSSEALSMVMGTLEAVAMGGIHDHLGHGFHRYATDREWVIPHFEKMLYDQALLMMAFTEAFQASGKAWLAETVDGLFTYVKSCLTSPQGGFYSAEDADSEGEEGLFYLWRLEELEQLLGTEDARLIVETYNVKREGNYLEEATSRCTGRNILFRQESEVSVAKRLGMPVESYRSSLCRLKKRLLEVRNHRVRPLLDDKVLTDWNGLMIAALARASQVLGNRDYRDAAEKACGFILDRMMTGEGGLLHRYREGEAAISGLLDDYAALVLALIDLYEASFDTVYLEQAVLLSDYCMEHFSDPEQGAFYQSSDRGESILLRRIELFDAAVPSGNALMLYNLLRLGHMTGSSRYLQAADRLARSYSNALRSHPRAHTFSLVALDFLIGPSPELVIAGREDDRAVHEMIMSLRRVYAPNKVVLFRPEGGKQPPLVEISPFTREQRMLRGRPTCYLCTDFTCNLPMFKVDEVLSVLQPPTKSPS